MYYNRVEMSNPHWTFGYYVTAWPRFTPYLVGILFGWLLHQTKNTKIIINRVIFKMIIARRSEIQIENKLCFGALIFRLQWLLDGP
jgi:hypothetical protein